MRTDSVSDLALDGKKVGCRVSFDDCEGCTHYVEIVDRGCIWNAAFNFDVTQDSDHYVTLEILDDNEQVVAEGSYTLKEVMLKGECSAQVPLRRSDGSQPDAALSCMIFFVEQPDHLPDNIAVTIIQSEKLVAPPSAEPSLISPYCKIWLEEEFLGHTKSVANGGPTSVWNECITSKYRGQQLLRISVYDQIGDKYIGEAQSDVWQILKEEPNAYKEGNLVLAAENDPKHQVKGKVHLTIRFFDDPKPNAEPPMSAASAPPEPAKKLENILEPDEHEQIVQNARRLAEEARENARQAEEAAAAATSFAEAPPLVSLCDQTAKAARNHSKLAQQGADTATHAASKLQSNLKRSEVAPLMDELNGGCGQARTGKDKAIQSAMDGANISAAAAVKKAEDAAARARRYANETAALAAKYPSVQEIGSLARGGDEDANDAHAQVYAVQEAADRCRQAPTYMEAIKNASIADKAAARAVGDAADAEEKLKKAKLLAKENERLEEKRAAKLAQKEKEALQREEAERERQRLAAHEEEMKRRKEPLSSGDVAEVRMYQGVFENDYHNNNNHATGRRLSMDEAATQLCMCYPSYSGRNEGDNSSSAGHYMGVPSDSKVLNRGNHGRERQPLLPFVKSYSTSDRDAIVETMAMNRPWCWCFGCGCCRCCGEC